MLLTWSSVTLNDSPFTKDNCPLFLAVNGYNATAVIFTALPSPRIGSNPTGKEGPSSIKDPLSETFSATSAIPLFI